MKLMDESFHPGAASGDGGVCQATCFARLSNAIERGTHPRRIESVEGVDRCGRHQVGRPCQGDVTAVERLPVARRRVLANDGAEMHDS